MPDEQERGIGDLTVRIDRLLCVGFGDCVDVAPDLFELDQEGIAVFRDTAGTLDRGQVIAACEACPIDALTVLDGDGTPVVP